MSDKISVRIMGVPERIENIRKNQAILEIPDEQIFIDEDHAGVMFNARRAWLFPTDAPFTMVLQDDVELCDNFMSYCERIVNVHPHEVIGFVSSRFFKPVAGSRLPTKSPYVMVRDISGQGIMMPTEYVRPCIDTWMDERNGDDINIIRWAERNGVTMLTTIPSLIRHIGRESVFDPSRDVGDTKYFDMNPEHANWDCGYVTPVHNIIR